VPAEADLFPPVVNYWQLLLLLLRVSFIPIEIFLVSEVLVDIICVLLIGVPSPGLCWVLQIAEKVQISGEFFRRDFILVLLPLTLNFLIESILAASAAYHLPQ
jgi:hypothetical protein